MDSVLCDELLQEIFLRLLVLSPSSSSAVSLVSRRWLHLYRTCKTSLSLHFPPHDSVIPPLSSLLSHYPFLSSLSLSSSELSTTPTSLPDQLVLVVSSYCHNLKHLKCHVGPASFSLLASLSNSCTHLVSMSISLSRPLSFNWVVSFPCLKELSVSLSGENAAASEKSDAGSSNDVELSLESLHFSGIRNSDYGCGWLWGACKSLRKLVLKNCEGIGDNGSFYVFIKCLKGLQEVELRTCRTVVDGVLLNLAENCFNLNSLLVYDGGSREGLLHFISHCRCDLRRLDLRLPLDLDNDHLFAAARDINGLSSIRLQSCCLPTGEGLKALGIAMNRLEELALVNCDVLEREPGLLTSLGQNLRMLRKLDLSYNEMLLDKEFISMLVSCNSLIDLKLRGCKGLTDATLHSVFRYCKQLESVDIMHCCGIKAGAVEFFLFNSTLLRHVQVEESKLSNRAKSRVLDKFIVVGA